MNWQFPSLYCTHDDALISLMLGSPSQKEQILLQRLLLIQPPMHTIPFPKFIYAFICLSYITFWLQFPLPPLLLVPVPAPLFSDAMLYNANFLISVDSWNILNSCCLVLFLHCSHGRLFLVLITDSFYTYYFMSYFIWKIIK